MSALLFQHPALTSGFEPKALILIMQHFLVWAQLVSSLLPSVAGQAWTRPDKNFCGGPGHGAQVAATSVMSDDPFVFVLRTDPPTGEKVHWW